jgi:hypothetical protein
LWGVAAPAWFPWHEIAAKAAANQMTERAEDIPFIVTWTLCNQDAAVRSYQPAIAGEAVK